MNPFKTFTGLVAPLDRNNIDTDAIIPKQYLKSVERSGFGDYLFDDWRYLDRGDLLTDIAQRRPNPEFILNQRRYQHASILLTRDNFGCGSSREHAVWALVDYGFHAIIGSSYSDIFYSNACKNGLLVIRLDPNHLDDLFMATASTPDYQLTVNLERQQITDPQRDMIYHFDLDQGIKKHLLQGLNDIDLTLSHAQAIKAYEKRKSQQYPWLFPDLSQKKPPR